MKIGLDIAWMSSKRTVDKLVLVAGEKRRYFGLFVRVGSGQYQDRIKRTRGLHFAMTAAC
jgi:hypothetical protein